MDVSSEMIHALLPLYLVGVLGASYEAVGWIEGVAEATASITKVFSGVVSDWVGRRKGLAVIGYGLAAVTKPVFPLANSIGWVVAARFIDRIGKGIRGAPRDALVSEIAPAHLRGASFGLRQTLDTIGAFTGPLLAMALMALSANSYRTVFWVAVIPGFLSVAMLVLAVREPARPQPPRRAAFPLALSELKRLGSHYWLIVAIATVAALARFSEAFLILRASAVGLPVMLAPLVLVAMNIAYALAVYPAGALSDRVNRLTLLAIGFVLLIGADVVMALSNALPGVALGVILWGLHMGFTQGIFAALVADASPPALRGAAYGFYNLLGGLAVLAASGLAGLLWDVLGAPAAFLTGAAFAAIALSGVALARRWAPAIGASGRR
ncbi:MAG: MFS transporter [Pseudomonadota bacterium]|nr:MFS transporter [Pseudomonadota bacterium]